MTYHYDRFKLDYYDLTAFPGPKPGDQADDFTVATMDGGEAKLSDYFGQWVVLETGSLTCNMYARNIDRMDDLRRRYPDVEFLMVYVREAHPGSKTPQHKSIEDKRRAAVMLRAMLGENRAILLDDMEGTMHRHYGAMPNMVYVINPSGTILYRHDWTVVEDLDRVLQNRDQIHTGEHAYSGDLKAFGPGAILHLFKNVARGGWDALWDLVKVMPLILVEHLKVERHYRQKEAAKPSLSSPSA